MLRQLIAALAVVCAALIGGQYSRGGQRRRQLDRHGPGGVHERGSVGHGLCAGHLGERLGADIGLGYGR